MPLEVKEPLPTPDWVRKLLPQLPEELDADLVTELESSFAIMNQAAQKNPVLDIPTAAIMRYMDNFYLKVISRDTYYPEADNSKPMNEISDISKESSELLKSKTQGEFLKDIDDALKKHHMDAGSVTQAANQLRQQKGKTRADISIVLLPVFIELRTMGYSYSDLIR